MPKLYLDFGESLTRLRNYIEKYNERFKTGATVEGRPTFDLNKKLRGQHRDLMQFIIRTYAKELNGQEAGAKALRPFRTNSVALGKAMDCSPRTIRNLTARLLDARIILEKHHRGRKRCYDLVINPAVYACQGFESQTVPIEHIVCAAKNLPDKPDEDVIRQTMPELKTGFTLKKNNQSCGQVENENRCSPTETQGVGTGFPRMQRLSKTTKVADNETRMQRGETHESSPHRGRGAVSPDALFFTDRKAFEEYAIRLRGLIQSTLYKRLEYFATSQEKAIRSFIEREFAGIEAEEYDLTYQNLRTRIMLAYDYVERNPAKRYIQIPSQYFDPENRKGFNGTKRWLENMRNAGQRKTEMSNRYQLLMKGWGAFMTQVGKFVAKPSLETYSKGRADLAEKYQPMLQAYDYVTLECQKQQFQA